MIVNMFIVQVTVVMLINNDRNMLIVQATVVMFIFYEYKMFIVLATGLRLTDCC
jgi:hypothetical protein